MPFFVANPEGALSGWGPAPHLEAGNISGIISTLVGERLKRQQQLQQAMEGIGQAMQQRKYDQIANAAADQLATQSGIAPLPMTGSAGEGEQRLNAVKALVAGQRQPVTIGEQTYNLPANQAAQAALTMEGYKGGYYRDAEGNLHKAGTEASEQRA